MRHDQLKSSARSSYTGLEELPHDVSGEIYLQWLAASCFLMYARGYKNDPRKAAITAVNEGLSLGGEKIAPYLEMGLGRKLTGEEIVARKITSL